MDWCMPACSSCSRSWNSHMTMPQQTAANIEKYFGSGRCGVIFPGRDEGTSEISLGIMDATTLEQTYRTIYIHC